MAKIKYTREQIKELKENKYVKDCSEKYLTFTDEFKMKVLKWVEKWKYHRQIFYDCGFLDYVWATDLVPRIVGNWKYKMKNKWLEWIIGTKKWRKKGEKVDISKMTKEELITYYKAENAYLKELYKQAHWHYP